MSEVKNPLALSIRWADKINLLLQRMNETN